MGNNTSSHVLATPLVPQPRFPRVINQRFVREHFTTLRVPMGFWSHEHATPLEIVDEEMREVVFKINGSRAGSTPLSKRLLDKNGVPVVSMDCYPVGLDYAMYVPQVPLPTSLMTTETKPVWQESRALCYFQTSVWPLEKRLYMDLEDPMTREPLKIKVEGVWPSHEALFLLYRARSTRGDCIARVFVEPEVRERLKQLKHTKKKHPLQCSSEDDTMPPLTYCVGIAPGVDVAMVLLACAAMDEEMTKKESGVEVVIPDDEITKLLAQRHHGTGDKTRYKGRPIGTTLSSSGL